MYYKWIANYATYDFNQGGDLAFSRGNAVRLYAKGDNEGKPRNQTGTNFISNQMLHKSSKV